MTRNELMLSLIATVGVLWSARQFARVLGGKNTGIVEQALSVLFRVAYWTTTIIGINFAYVFICTIKQTVC